MQKHGLEAIGALVERDFGGDGVFVGTVVGFSDEKGVGKLYRVQYSDGDVEGLDQEEYNFAYAKKMKSDGWVLEDGPIEGGGAHGDVDGVSEDSDGDKDSDDEYVVDILAREKAAASQNGRVGDGNEVPAASDGGGVDGLSPYEQLRAKNTVRNKKMMHELGLLTEKPVGIGKKRKNGGESVKKLTQKRKVFAYLWISGLC